MNAITLRTRTGEWLVRPISPDPLARVHDRALRDLLEDLEAAIDVMTDVVVGPDGGKLSALDGEQVRNVLSTAFDFLVEIRRADAR
jgi:hypothetical protein